MPTYLENEIGLSADQSLVVPIIGMLDDDGVPAVRGTAVGSGRAQTHVVVLAGGPVRRRRADVLADGYGLVGAVIGFAVLGLLYVPQLATISATFPAMFPTHVRYAGMAIAYNVSTSLFGGTAPAVNEWLIGRTGDRLVRRTT